ncbi:MAG: hypothetical protein LLG04_08570 [Parachlamydia sp.]|nr:hypothetical protein [Parachlamydia sp.]
MKKKNETLESVLDKSDLSDTFAEHPIVQWISQNGRSLLWLLLGLVALFLIGYRLLSGYGGSGAKDYFAVDKELGTFLTANRSETGAAQAKESLEKLTRLLNNHPDLRAKYEGLIAQELIVRGDATAALPLAERTLARVSKEHIPLYSDYSATTLLIEKGSYPEALNQATALQAKLNEKDSSGLFAANLLRIAMLNQKLGKKEDELKAWQTLNVNLTKEDNDQVVRALSEGRLSILDYIAFREKELKPDLRSNFTLGQRQSLGLEKSQKG